MSNFAATVNAAPPYIVNDLYKRFVNPDADPRTYVRLSYVASLGVVIAGVGVGWLVESIDTMIQWITAAFWGGYAASNVLKWYWWRFNGFGYFWGMVAGIGAAMVLPFAAPGLSPLNSFPFILLIGLAGCLLGTFMTAPEDDEILKSFYRRVRPWGFWGPILAKVRQEDPSFVPNRDFVRDMFNIVVGIVWQTSLVAIPICIVIRRFPAALIAASLAAATALVLKFTWYDHLDRREAAFAPSSAAP
jgi:SSS family solute:Na+ symporter